MSNPVQSRKYPVSDKDKNALAERYALYSLVMGSPEYAKDLLLLAEEHAKLEHIREELPVFSDSLFIIRARIAQIEEEQDALYTDFFQREEEDND
ncbi:hypothetical protein [Paenibacillus sp. CMAA1364]